MTPLVKITIGSTVFDEILSFVFEDSILLDNLMEFSLKGHTDLISQFDDGLFNSGETIVFEFGYINGITSATHVAIIVDREVSYDKDGGITLKIRCLDKGTVLKRVEIIKDWSGKTSSQIAEEISGKYDLFYTVEKTKRVHTVLHQTGQNDFEFLKYLALIEEKGDFVFFIRDNMLYFVRRGLDKDSFAQYVYGASETILSFKTSSKDSIVPTEVSGVTSKTSKKTKDKDEVVTSDLSSNSAVNLGNYQVSYQTDKFEGLVRKELVLPNFEKVEMVNMTSSLQKEARLKILTGTLVIEGNPTLSPDEVITMQGKLLKRDVGNWYITKVTHSIDRGYRVTLEIAKNATADINSGAKNSKSTVNTSVGVGESSDEVVINVYDPNKKLIGQKTKSGKFISVTK